MAGAGAEVLGALVEGTRSNLVAAHSVCLAWRRAVLRVLGQPPRLAATLSDGGNFINSRGFEQAIRS